jgi:SAM-dependent methyltransferase
MKNNTEFYMTKLVENISNEKKVGWDNVDKAIKRYETIKSLIPKNCKSVIDFGCGIGLFSKYTDLDYYGLDIEKSYIDYALENCLDKSFKCINVNDKFLPIVADCLVNIGAYTLCINSNHNTYWNDIKCQIKNQLCNIKKCMIINGFHDVVDYKDDKLFYHSLNNWVKLSQELNVKCEIYIFEKYEFIVKLNKD